MLYCKPWKCNNELFESRRQHNPREIKDVITSVVMSNSQSAIRCVITTIFHCKGN